MWWKRIHLQWTPNGIRRDSGRVCGGSLAIHDLRTNHKLWIEHLAVVNQPHHFHFVQSPHVQLLDVLSLDLLNVLELDSQMLDLDWLFLFMSILCGLIKSWAWNVNASRSRSRTHWFDEMLQSHLWLVLVHLSLFENGFRKRYLSHTVCLVSSPLERETLSSFASQEFELRRNVHFSSTLWLFYFLDSFEFFLDWILLWC